MVRCWWLREQCRRDGFRLARALSSGWWDWGDWHRSGSFTVRMAKHDDIGSQCSSIKREQLFNK
jgi:hypothetical protein